MIRTQKTGILILAALLGASLSSCKTDSVPNNPSTGEPTEMTFASSATYKYRQADLDTTGSTNPSGGVQESPTPNADTIISTVISTTATYKGKTNVTIVENLHTRADLKLTRDTTWYYQENGNVYRYNFGVDFLNSFKFLQSFLVDDQNQPKPIDVGWVLQARLRDTTVGAKWATGDGEFTLNHIPVLGKLQGTIIDTAQYVGASTITVDGVSYRVKQYKHNLTLVAGTTVKAEIDTYVSAYLGATVKNVAHSTRVSMTGLVDQQVPGLMTTMFETSLKK